ncbi:MAG: hypothetical protein IJY80_04870, partial [Opitutales bacterium]|nr:hypothetical protein [Opitutales bacterium]
MNKEINTGKNEKGKNNTTSIPAARNGTKRTIEYNAENRPARWTNAATGTVITMAYDSQGRRVEYKSVTNGTQN